MDVSEWTLTERLTLGGNEIAWARAGDGPPVVLVHGTPWSSWSWRHVVPYLTDAYTVYAFDLLGFGASEKREGQDVSLAAQGARLAELVGHWGLESPAVIAHDIGGGITLRAHLRHGLAVSALVLFDVVAIGAWGSPFYRLVGEHPQVFEALPPAIHEGVVRAYINTAQVRPLPREVEDGLVAPWLGQEGQAAFYRQIAQGDQRDTRAVEPRYGEITAPTLIAWGELDPWIPSERGRELAGRIPHARLELLPNAGHLLQEEDPGRVAELARAHLDSSV
jgi:pimeloyl-ACP methyl ester carboxylesterase